MMGHRHVARPSLVGVTDDDLRRQPDGKVHFVRVTGAFADDGRYHVRPVRRPGQPPAGRHRARRRARRLPDGAGSSRPAPTWPC